MLLLNHFFGAESLSFLEKRAVGLFYSVQREDMEAIPSDVRLPLLRFL